MCVVAFFRTAPCPYPCPLACGPRNGGYASEGNCGANLSDATDVAYAPFSASSAESYCKVRGRAQEKEDPRGTGQRFSLLNLAQPKNCKTKDLHKAKAERRDANTGRCVPKKRYSLSHFHMPIRRGMDAQTYVPFLKALGVCETSKE